jgi:hypothetical protein
MCAGAYVWEGFADYVLATFDARPGAGAPSITEDPVALLRHSVAARRTRLRRDALLLLVAATTAAVVTAQLGARTGYGAAVLVQAAGIAAWAGRRLLTRGLRALWLWAWKAHQYRSKRPLRFIVAVAVAVLVVVASSLVQPEFWQCVRFAAIPLAVGWAIVVIDAYVAHRRAGAVLADRAPDARHLVPAVDGTAEARAAAMATMNVVVYSGDRGSNPFVGNGFIVKPASLDVDVNKRASDDASKVMAFDLFDVTAFHEALAERFSVECDVESTPTRWLSSGHRLYVDGRRIAWKSRLLDACRPVAWVDWDDLIWLVTDKDHADDRRVYFFVQEVVREGNLGVCILIRPILQSGKLWIEVVPLYLPPLNSVLEEVIDKVPRGRRDQLLRAITTGTLGTPTAIFGSPVRCAVRTWRWLARRWNHARWWLAARFDWSYDHGADLSIREGACLLEPKEHDHFVIQDLVRIYDGLMDRVRRSIEAYLREVGVDTTQFEKAATVNIQSWTVGTVRAEMVGFGNNHTFGAPPPESSDPKVKDKK